LRTVYNGIDLRHFTLRERRGDYLAFLGRISDRRKSRSRGRGVFYRDDPTAAPGSPC
jgi:hypothetical protein